MSREQGSSHHSYSSTKEGCEGCEWEYGVCVGGGGLESKLSPYTTFQLYSNSKIKHFTPVQPSNFLGVAEPPTCSQGLILK